MKLWDGSASKGLVYLTRYVFSSNAHWQEQEIIETIQ